MANGDTFDRGALLRRCLYDRKIAGELLALFRDEMPVVFNRLDKAVAEKNGLLAQRLAHTLKGAALNIDAKRLADVAFAYEQLPSTETLVHLREVFRLTLEDVQRPLPAVNPR